MGEYADEQFRRDVKQKFGFDPGSMYGDERPEKKKAGNKKQCDICKRWFGGLPQHKFDVHKIPKA